MQSDKNKANDKTTHSHCRNFHETLLSLLLGRKRSSTLAYILDDWF